MITESFDDMLDDLLHRIAINLQISPTMHDLAESHYVAVGKWLRQDGSPLSHLKPWIYPQGSLRIGTTVRPRKQDEYDLDLVCEFERLNHQSVPNPVKLLDAVQARILENKIYQSPGMVERKNRCIRINYAHQFHMDILPAAPDEHSGENCVVVPDCKAEDWKHSNPKGYADWFEARTITTTTQKALRIDPLPDHQTAEEKPPLKRAVQLFKRERDVRYEKTMDLAPISIVLTTLCGHFYSGENYVHRAVGRILDRIVENIPSDGRRLIVLNPKNEKEDFSERWDNNLEAYRAFVAGISEFRATWNSLYKEQLFFRVVPTLEALFGEKITKQALSEQTKAINEMRERGGVGIKKATGTITSSTSAYSIPAKPNTFYGEE